MHIYILAANLQTKVRKELKRRNMIRNRNPEM